MAAALLPLAAPAPAPAQEQAPPAVTVAHPVTRDIVEDDEFVGRFDASAEVEVRARVGGYLEAVHFQDGALVKAGDLLFTIDQRKFRTYLAQAESEVNVARASFDFAQDQLARAEALVGNGNIAQSVVDQRREAQLAARGALEQAREAVTQARIDLEYSEIHAPISGRIDRRRVTPGNLVRQDETVLTSIVAVDPIHFYFDIDERYYLAYARDARAREASLHQGGGGLKVKVTLSDPKVPAREGVLDFSENRLDRETGSMRVRAVLDNADMALAPGLFGRVNVPGSLPHPGVLVPDEAIVADQNRRLVMLVDAEGNVVPRLVRPGPRIDGYRVIREGLEGSETLVIEGLLRARPGAKVTPELVALPPIAAPPGEPMGVPVAISAED
ncbi:efflux RND transporter periplasmic adaptor subunit [uncultured Albimonas sp.]|uniref:efflux RND transporter periplasmic adaptor subunit n=1 Tax=uncultured Albimonas sp. TaxID=1331701 RepID=UPI0030EB2F5C